MLSRRLDAPSQRPVDGTSGGATPFLSPDGQMLGFERDGEMFVVPTSGGPTTRVKDADILAWSGRPAWSPDGRIVYTNERGALVMVRPDGTASEQLTTPADGTRHLSPVVLPDGRTVLFAEVTGNVNDARIVALSLMTAARAHSSVGGAMTPQYADGFLFYCRPDGTLMAAPFDAARVELTGEARALPDRVDRSRFGVAHYAAAPGVLLYAPYAQTRLVEMDARGAVTALTEEGRWHMPRYSPDGMRIVLDHVTGAGADRDVWTLVAGRQDALARDAHRRRARSDLAAERNGGVVSKLQIARRSIDDRGSRRERRAARRARRAGRGAVSRRPAAEPRCVAARRFGLSRRCRGAPRKQRHLALPAQRGAAGQACGWTVRRAFAVGQCGRPVARLSEQ